jgi:hypothetical protein
MGITRIEDQASGLRKLFNPHGGYGPGWPVLHALVCPARPALSLPLTQALANAWADQGYCLAWIDELDLTQRQRWPWPCRIRYDLSQAMADHVPLAAAMQRLDERLWYASARHMDRLNGDRAWPLARRLSESGVAFDSVFISVSPDSQRLWPCYGGGLHYTVVIGPTRADLEAAMDWMTRVPAAGVLSWRLLPAGPSVLEAGGLQAMVETASALLGQPVELMGPVQASWQEGDLMNVLPAVDALSRALLERLLRD